MSRETKRIGNHLELRKVIDAEIDTRRLKKETKLPREIDFVSRYRVSRNMVRRALADIEKEGRITKVKGTGTFINNEYTPAKKKTSTIGLIVPTYTFQAIAKIISGVSKELSANGYSLLIENSDNDSRKERKNIEQYIDRDVEGIILYPSTDVRRSRGTAAVFDTLRRKNIPLVAVDRDIAFVEGNTPQNTLVTTDDTAAVRKALQYLISHGHKEIAMVNSVEVKVNVAYFERRRAYLDFMNERGAVTRTFDGAPYAYDAIVKRAYNGGAAYAAIAGKITRDKSITAVLACDDITAYNLGQEFIRCGVRIPDDISIVGFGNIDFDFAVFGVTSVDQKLGDMGTVAAKNVLDAGRGRIMPVRRILIDTELVEKGSVADRSK